MPDVVYYVRPGENEELRYSLRSVAENVPGARVSVIGGYPDWLNLDTVRIFEGNPHEVKQFNGIANVMIALENFPGDFLIFNDDFMILKPLTTPLPFYYKQSMDSHAVVATTQTPEGRLRKKMLIDTSVYLKHHHVPYPNSYETHIPMWVNGATLKRLIHDYWDWHQYEPGTPLMWRSLYANKVHNPAGKLFRRDVITHGVSTYLEARDFISTNERTVDPILPYLSERFPHPSRWEL